MESDRLNKNNNNSMDDNSNNNGEDEMLTFEQFDNLKFEKPKNSQEIDSAIYKQTLKTLDTPSSTTTTTTTGGINTNSNINTKNKITEIKENQEEPLLNEKEKQLLKDKLFKYDDISDDDDEEIKKKKKEIDSIQPHYSSEDELIKFNIQDLKSFIEKLEQSNVELALEFQNDPDPVYYESINENIQVIEKKKKVLKDLEDLLVKKEGLFL